MNNDSKTNQDWREAVNKSFLPPEEKLRLLEILKDSGPSSQFIFEFDSLLAAAIDQISVKYEKALNDFDRECETKDEAYLNKKKQLDEKLENDLSKTESDDNRDLILDRYYSDLDELMNHHEKEIKLIGNEALKEIIAN